MLRRLVVALVVLAVVGALADRLASAWVAAEVEREVRRSVDGVRDVDVDLGFPFLLPVALSGRTGDADVRLTDIARDGVVVDEVRVRVEGLEVDRGALVRRREVEVVDVERVQATAHLGEAMISALVGVPVAVSPGRVRYGPPGAERGAAVELREGAVVLRPDGAGPVAVPVPVLDLVPCAVTVEAVANGVRVACQLTELPPALAEALER